MIDFSRERWDRVRDVSRRWWRGDLGRPMLALTTSRQPDRPPAAVPAKGFTAHYSFDVPAADIVDAWDYQLAGTEFVADGFPSVWLNFGPGAAAAFLGCRVENTPHSVWFHAPAAVGIDDLQLSFDPRNRWLVRVRDIARTAAERWRGGVQVGMTDLGGTLDILSSFLPGEQLLTDLLDAPDRVQQLVWQIHAFWFHFFDLVDGEHRMVNPGHTAWTPIFSEERYYMLQCDFAYMIGPAMFDAFVKPELQAACRRIPNAFYHLDGIGQLPHLDSLLAIPELKGIQWIPGDGQPDITHWPEVYRRIRKAGKLVQIFSGQAKQHGWRVIDVLAEQLGNADGIVMIGSFDPRERREVDAMLKRHGAL